MLSRRAYAILYYTDYSDLEDKYISLDLVGIAPVHTCNIIIMMEKTYEQHYKLKNHKNCTIYKE